MGEKRLYVVDATVVGKWYLRDETLVEPALRIFDDFTSDRIGLIAPSHLWYEVTSIFAKAVGVGRIAADQAYRASELFQRANIPVVHSQVLIRQGLEYSIRFQCPLYDATYLALADLTESQLLSADSRLRRTLRDRFARLHWIEDDQGPNG